MVIKTLKAKLNPGLESVVKELLYQQGIQSNCPGVIVHFGTDNEYVDVFLKDL